MKEKIEITIDGMTCVNCENRIERILNNSQGVENVNISYSKGIAVIIFNSQDISLDEIKSKIEKVGYTIIDNPSKTKYGIVNGLVLVFILVGVFILINSTVALEFFNAFPTAKTGMGYGSLFLIGILTSIHCVGMCGGINLSQCISQGNKVKEKTKHQNLRPSVLYNLGRVISYTIVGGLVGLLGSAISFSGAAKGLIAILAGIFMIIMALNMWGVFPWLKKLNPRMPKVFARKINDKKKSNSPLYVGLLNGLMPCGPLQAMQLFALSTGDPLKGALSMFFFSIGTVPLMFGLGALSTLLTKKFQKRMVATSAILVLVLGIVMVSNGASLSGFSVPNLLGNGERATAEVNGNVQEVKTNLQPDKYTPITVKRGIPVKWTIVADESNLNSCNNQILIPQYNIDKKLKIGNNTITFTPEKSGTVPFSCWMGMIKSQINVENQIMRGRENEKNNN